MQVDIRITQEDDPSITHTWTDYKFGDFSNWVNQFKPGSGKVEVWEVSRCFIQSTIDGLLVVVVVWLHALVIVSSPVALALQNVGGSRGQLLYTLNHIPLTPGPLMVVLKVAASQVTNASGYWPPTLPDTVETVAASYVQSERSAKVRLFNLSPSTKSAGLICSGNGTKEIVSNVR